MSSDWTEEPCHSVQGECWKSSQTENSLLWRLLIYLRFELNFWIQLITEDTVDAHIYRMQERKAKMNAAILETGKDGESTVATNKTGKKPNKQTESKKEVNDILQTAISDFEFRNKTT